MMYATRFCAISIAISSALAIPFTIGSAAGTCSPLEHGNGPVPSSDTADAFLSHGAFGDAATSATTPSGFMRAYANEKFTYNEPSQFITYIGLDTYDVSQCKYRLSM